MLSRLELLIDLLHSALEAALATHSTTLDGFPFASAVPFVTDEHHRPVILISGLAEHSRNLAANPRASLMIAKFRRAGEIARVSLVGEVLPIDADPMLVTRYLRYHPHAKRFLQLGDFRFHRFEPAKVLTVAGFAKAGWLDGDRLLKAPTISLADEAELIRQYEQTEAASHQLRGVDAFGVDLALDGRPVRMRFKVGPVTQETALPMLRKELAAMRRTIGNGGSPRLD